MLLALSLLVVGALVSAILLLPPGSGIGIDGEVTATGSDPMHALDVRRETLIDHADARGDRRGRRLEPQPARRAKSPISPARPAVEPGGIGEYLDPEAFYPVWASGGIVSDGGDFQDPDYDVPVARGDGTTSHVGEYIEPKDAP